MYAWVTGTRGFIGSRLVAALRERGSRVLRIASRAPDSDAVYLEFADRESVRDAVTRYGAPDVLFHLGWGAMENPEAPAHMTENVRSATTFIEELYRCGTTKIIVAGSINEYGSREGELREADHPTGRLTKYAQGKRMVADAGFAAATRYGTTYLHVRLSNVLGAPNGKSSLINSLFQAYTAGTNIELTPCDQFRDYVYVADAVEGLIQISALDTTNIVNLGSGTSVRLRHVVEVMWSTLGGDPASLLFGARQRPPGEPDQQACYVSLEKLQRLTRWRPTISLDEGILRTVAELRSRQ